jgi:hypothetical protein
MKFEPVRIVLKEGPVILRSLNGAGVNMKYALWNGIVASDFFPPGVDSAFYVLSLEKMVAHSTEVEVVEAELITSLNFLALAWPFSGGSFMVPESRNEAGAPRYESNAQQVGNEQLAREGLRPVKQIATIGFETLANYLQPPLATASRLAVAMRDKPVLGKLLQYHQQAWVEYYYRSRIESPSWFIDLYKIREVLGTIYGGESKTRNDLSISNNDWKYFGSILNNNDLRHAEVCGEVPPVKRPEVDRLYELARLWIQAHLVRAGLPVHQRT